MTINNKLQEAIAAGLQDAATKREEERRKEEQSNQARQRRSEEEERYIREKIGDAQPLFDAIREHVAKYANITYNREYDKGVMYLTDDIIRKLLGKAPKEYVCCTPELARVLSELDGITASYETHFVTMDDDGNGYDSGTIHIKW